MWTELGYSKSNNTLNTNHFVPLMNQVYCSPLVDITEFDKEIENSCSEENKLSDLSSSDETLPNLNGHDFSETGNELGSLSFLWRQDDDLSDLSSSIGSVSNLSGHSFLETANDQGKVKFSVADNDFSDLPCSEESMSNLSGHSSLETGNEHSKVKSSVEPVADNELSAFW